MRSPVASALPVRRVEFEVFRDLAFPAIAVGQQARLVEVEFLACFRGVFEVRSLDDGVDRACLLAQPAIDTLDHVDIVARRAAAAVFARLRLDGDRLRRTNRFAQFAGDATLFAVRIAAQCMLTAEARAERALLEG